MIGAPGMEVIMGDIATKKNSPQMNNEFLIGIEVRSN
jgi:hypothetical protein